MSSKLTFTSRLAAHAELTLAQKERWRLAMIAITAILLVAPIVLSLIALHTDWDLQLADVVFDFNNKAFPMRHAWVTEVFNHVILKRLFITLAIAFLLTVALDFARPRLWSWLRRFQLRVVAVSAVCIPAVISFVKLQSDSHCPWDLARYGGAEPYVRLFESLPPGVTAGHCMPAGHASSALWMISLAIFFVPYRLSYAASTLGGFLLVGLGVGWMQQLRGAHFLTHTLWSLWVALATLVAIVVVMDRWPRRKATSPRQTVSKIGQARG